MASLTERVQYGGKKSWRIALEVKVGAHKHNMVKAAAMEQQNSESVRLPRREYLETAAGAVFMAQAWISVVNSGARLVVAEEGA
jgi:hypothetical protein